MDCWWLWRCAAADCGGGDRRGDAESSGVVRQELCVRSFVVGWGSDRRAGN
nr:hypothetical protein Iba_chr14bCG11310 [Ipomoea batatas]